MNLKTLVALFTFALLGSIAELPVCAIELPVNQLNQRNIAEIIQREKQFAFTDGSSYYIFKADGTFSSTPNQLWGRVITGTWKTTRGEALTGGNAIVIEGQWSWRGMMGGLLDYRRMTMTLYPPSVYETESNRSDISKLYKCYFIIDGVVKIAKPSALK